MVRHAKQTEVCSWNAKTADRLNWNINRYVDMKVMIYQSWIPKRSAQTDSGVKENDELHE